MHFESPWRLLALAPFAAFVLWLLIGLHKRARVPFLSLWPGEMAPPQRDRRVHLPPPPIVLILLAMLLGLLGLADPVLRNKNDALPQSPDASPKITHAALRAGQLMIQISNAPSPKPLELILEHEQARQTHLLNPSATGLYFIDFKPQPDELRLTLDSGKATLKRQGAWPRVVRQAPLGAWVERVIASYENARKPSENSPVLKIAASLNVDESGIVAGKFSSANAEPRVVEHPITANVKTWPLAGGDAPEGWTPLVQRGPQTLLAIREENNIRQAWLAMDFSDWDATPDFVVFWTNLLDFLAGPSTHYVFHPAAAPENTDEPPRDIPLAPGFWTIACLMGLISAVLFTRKNS